MATRQELFKVNRAVLSPDYRKVLQRKNKLADREEKRNNLFNQRRDINFTPNSFAASTPNPVQNKKVENKENNNNVEDENVLDKEAESTNNEKSIPDLQLNEKSTRAELHFQLYLQWKARKAREKEEKKKNFKPPFIAVGKPKPIINKSNGTSFAPDNHRFRPPAGLPVLELEKVEEKRKSIYLAAPTPPKKQKIPEIRTKLKHVVPNSATTVPTVQSKKVISNAAVANEVGILQPNILNQKDVNLSPATTSKATEKAPAVADTVSSQPVKHHATTSKGAVRKQNVGTAKESEIADPVSSQPVEHHATASKCAVRKQNVGTAKESEIAIPVASQPVKHHAMTSKGAVRKQNVGTAKEPEIAIPVASQPVKHHATTSKGAVRKQNVGTAKEPEIADPVSSQPVKHHATTSKGAVRKQNVGTAKESEIADPVSSQPVEHHATTSKGAVRKQNVGTAKEPEIAIPVASQPVKQHAMTSKGAVRKQNVGTAKEPEIAIPVASQPVKYHATTSKGAVRKQNVAALSKTALTKNTNVASSSGAAGKAKSMQQRKQKNDINLEANDKNLLKPKLKTNFKAKKPANHATNLTKNKFLNALLTVPTSNETPANSEVIKGNDGLVTSTQMKSASTSALPLEGFSKLCKIISPIKSLDRTRPGPTVSAKRRLLQEPMKETDNCNSRRFQFVRQVQLDVTGVDSPLSEPTNEKPKCDEETLKPENKGIILNSETATPKIGKTKSQLSQLILQKMQMKLDKKPENITAINKDKSNSRMSIQLESRVEQKTPLKNKKHKFLVEFNKSMSVIEDPATVEQQETLKEASSDRPLNYVGPFVSVSRGKVSARKEKEKRNSIYLQDTPTKAAPEIQKESPVEKRRALEAVHYFRQQLKDETERLHALCDQWNAYKEEQLQLLQEKCGEDMINVTTGQTRLLTSKKFMQFSGLIDRCEAHANGTAIADDGSESTKTITAVDLEGFWSMLKLQVENIEKRFKNLDRFKNNNWDDPDAVDAVKPRIKKNAKKPKVVEISDRGNARRQMMREKIAEMRAKQKEEGKTEIEVIINDKIKTPSVRRSRSLTHGNDSPGRMNIVVPDRKSRSLARTVISVPIPGTSSPKNVTCEKENLLKATLRRCTRNSFHSEKPLRTPSPALREPINSQPITPSTSTLSNCSSRKSILKTPGTARKQTKNVVFNNELSVQKIRPLKYDNARHVIDFEDHIENSDKMDENSLADEKANEERCYRLRTRKVKLRPSCEIIIP